jgi:hypothetical protein
MTTPQFIRWLDGKMAGHGGKLKRLFRLAALQGDASAQSNLGVMYYKGQGIARADEISKHRVQVACERAQLERDPTISAIRHHVTASGFTAISLSI